MLVGKDSIVEELYVLILNADADFSVSIFRVETVKNGEEKVGGNSNMYQRLKGEEIFLCSEGSQTVSTLSSSW
jgi:hypothetical protein